MDSFVETVALLEIEGSLDTTAGALLEDMRDLDAVVGGTVVRCVLQFLVVVSTSRNTRKRPTSPNMSYCTVLYAAIDEHHLLYSIATTYSTNNKARGLRQTVHCAICHSSFSQYLQYNGSSIIPSFPMCLPSRISTPLASS